MMKDTNDIWGFWARDNERMKMKNCDFQEMGLSEKEISDILDLKTNPIIQDDVWLRMYIGMVNSLLELDEYNESEMEISRIVEILVKVNELLDSLEVDLSSDEKAMLAKIARKIGFCEGIEVRNQFRTLDDFVIGIGLTVDSEMVDFILDVVKATNNNIPSVEELKTFVEGMNNNNVRMCTIVCPSLQYGPLGQIKPVKRPLQKDILANRFVLDRLKKRSFDNVEIVVADWEPVFTYLGMECLLNCQQIIDVLGISIADIEKYLKFNG
ncbi:MAG TPA: hypothetical protein PK957_03885, partial [Candidatus Dojkabacteria bacterium]|nr:hypothetical protein [Candidatus Dojkabacteria bacterium]